MRLVTRFIYAISLSGFISQLALGEEVTQVLSCSVKTIGSICGSRQVSLLMSNGKFRLQNGDNRCWGGDSVASGELEAITQAPVYHGIDAKGYELKGTYSSHTENSIIGHVYISNDQRVARVILGENKPFVSFASDYHLVCNDEQRKVESTAINEEVCLTGWAATPSNEDMRIALERQLQSEMNKTCESHGHSALNSSLVLFSDFGAYETFSRACPFGLLRYTLTSRFICSR